MTPNFYNPCQDGFPAKVWECLRRNEEFKAAYKRIDECPNSPDPEAQYFEYLLWQHVAEEEKEENFYADAVLSSLLEAPTWDLEKTWPKHSDKLRVKLALKYPAPMPRKWVGPSGEACHHDAGKALDLVYEAEDFMKDYHMIAVPRFIRDNKHREAILLAIEKLIPRSKTDARYFKPKGRMLGTKAEWDVYLFVEQLNAERSLGERDAMAYAAWYYLERDTWKGQPDEYLFSAKGMRDARTILARRRSLIEARLQAVRKSVASVYPRFLPFSS